MLTDNGDGTVTRTGLPDAAKRALGVLESSTISVGNSRVDAFQLRQLALDHAVKTHGPTADEDQITKAAEAYLTFLAGAK